MDKSYSSALPKRARYLEVKTIEPTKKREATVTYYVAGRHNPTKARQVLEIQHDLPGSEIVAMYSGNVFDDDQLVIVLKSEGLYADAVAELHQKEVPFEFRKNVSYA